MSMEDVRYCDLYDGMRVSAKDTLCLECNQYKECYDKDNLNKLEGVGLLVYNVINDNQLSNHEKYVMIMDYLNNKFNCKE